jgi:hypothetical protein
MTQIDHARPLSIQLLSTHLASYYRLNKSMHPKALAIIPSFYQGILLQDKQRLLHNLRLS